MRTPITQSIQQHYLNYNQILQTQAHKNNKINGLTQPLLAIRHHHHECRDGLV
jgi:hypothetical protein